MPKLPSPVGVPAVGVGAESMNAIMSRHDVLAMLYPGMSVHRSAFYRLTNLGVIPAGGGPRIRLEAIDTPGGKACLREQVLDFLARFQGPGGRRAFMLAARGGAEQVPRHENGRKVRRDAGSGQGALTPTLSRGEREQEKHGRCGRNGAAVTPRPVTRA